MRRFFMSLTTVVVLLTGVIAADAAKCTDKFTLRFRENTLVVSSAQMEEATLYSLDGRKLSSKKGSYAEFELTPGTYRLYAKVCDQTIVRRIEMR